MNVRPSLVLDHDRSDCRGTLFDKQPSALRSSSCRDDPAMASPKILIIDDEQDVIELLTPSMLMRRQGPCPNREPVTETPAGFFSGRGFA